MPHPRFRGPRLSGRLLWLAAGAWLLAWTQVLAQGLARESAVKAAYLYKFGGFVEWPAGTFRAPLDPFVIGVHGSEPVASELEQIARGRPLDGRPVQVQRLRDAADAAPLHVLYVAGANEARTREVLAAVRGPVLTVTDGPVGGRHAPVLHFAADDGRVRFHASLPAADARQLRLSARLLAVAQSVEGR